MRLLRELVPKDNEFRPVVEKTTDASRRAIRKLLSRVDSLLDIAKMESGEFTIDREPAELATIADSVCVELSPLAHEMDVRVRTEIGDDLPLLNIDPDKVERALMNLVDNALKYSPSESQILIRASQINGQSNTSPSALVRLEVVDNGPGIPDDYKPRLFDRFVQIEGQRRVRRGVGLGLAFCKMVAEAHGGTIWVEDNPDGGSIFVMTLPVIRLNALEEDFL